MKQKWYFFLFRNTTHHKIIQAYSIEDASEKLRADNISDFNISEDIVLESDTCMLSHKFKVVEKPTYI